MCNFINFLVIVKFKLVLLYFLEVELFVCLNDLKIWFNLFDGMLIFVLLIVIFNKEMLLLEFFSWFFKILVEIFILFELVNLIVLLIKL